MQTIKIDNGPPGMRLIGFWVDPEFPAGEYRLVPVGEADAKDARIAELEKQLAERSLGVMPDGLRKILDAREKGSPTTYTSLVAAVEDYYAPPFVFDGTPGRYRLESGEEVDVDLTKGGRLIVFRKSGKLCSMMDADGTFAGGRITGRV